MKALSKEEAASIWAVDTGALSPKGLRDYAIVCIGLSMGFRASDIISLRFADVDWRQRSIRIIQKKTGKALIMPMPVKTGNILFRYIRDGGQRVIRRIYSSGMKLRMTEWGEMSARIEKRTFERLEKFCEDSGLGKTVTMERVLNMYMDEYYGSGSKCKVQ